LGLFIRWTGISPAVSTAAVSIQSIAAGTDVAYGTVIEVQLEDSSLNATEGDY